MNMISQSSITAPEGAIYLSDFMTEIPANCLFNKKHTGCGATELAIRNDVPTIYRQDGIPVLGVYGGVTDDDIISYVRSHDVLKIAVTYDSLPRTIEALKYVGVDPYRDLFLLVDE